MAKGFQTLQVDMRDGVAVVTVTRERVRDAFNEAMIEELDAAFGELGAEPAARAIVLAGRGPVFCSGADLEWMAKMAGFTEEENRRDALAVCIAERADRTDALSGVPDVICKYERLRTVRATYSSKRPVGSRSRSYRLTSGNGGNQDSRRTIQLS